MNPQAQARPQLRSRTSSPTQTRVTDALSRGACGVPISGPAVLQKGRGPRKASATWNVVGPSAWACRWPGWPRTSLSSRIALSGERGLVAWTLDVCPSLEMMSWWQYRRCHSATSAHPFTPMPRMTSASAG
jgi:hypothetical protein